MHKSIGLDPVSRQLILILISLIKIHIDSISLLLKHFLLTVFCIDLN